MNWKALYPIVCCLIFFVSSCQVSKKAAPIANVHTKVDKSDAPLPHKKDKKKAKEEKKEKKKTVAPIIKKEAEDTLAYLRKKYAPLLSTVQDSIQNLELYKVIDEWMGTPYRYGGQSKKGTDCSGFAGILYTKAFSVALARRVSEIHKTTPTLLKLEELKEGDLVFFDIGKRKLSHVGVYLTNGKFVHASTSQGVVISDLNMAYYKKYFRCGGRIIKS